MKPIDVILIDLPGMLSDILEAILERDSSVRIAAHLRSAGALATAVASSPVDVAIVGGDGGSLAAAVRDLLCERPALRVLTVGSDGREASLYELRPHRTPLGEVSAAELLEAVKAVGEEGCPAVAAGRARSGRSRPGGGTPTGSRGMG